MKALLQSIFKDYEINSVSTYEEEQVLKVSLITLKFKDEIEHDLDPFVEVGFIKGIKLFFSRGGYPPYEALIELKLDINHNLLTSHKGIKKFDL